MVVNKAAEEPRFAYLVGPAKDLVDNFNIDILEALNEYLDVIRIGHDEDAPEVEAAENFKVFNFGEACRVIIGAVGVYAKKVDHVYDLTLSVVDLLENKNSDEAKAGKRGGRRRVVNLGSTNYELMDLKSITEEALGQMAKAEKDEKAAVDDLRLEDNAEGREMQYEKKNILVEKPTQFMFKLNYGQLGRTDEQIQNAKARPDVIGKVKDFDIKKSGVIHEQQMLFTHDDYRHNHDEFTLPGARWIPDNKELAANFGVAEIEAELNLNQEAERISAFGPFKDPLSGREVVAPPRWYIEKEAVRQQQEIQSRATSRALLSRPETAKTLRDSQGFGSQPTRLSQPFVERNRNNLNQFVSFVEGRLNKNRPSTHLNTGLVEMFVDNFGGQENEFEPMDVDDFGGGGAETDGDDEEGDYVKNLTRNERKTVAPWDDLGNCPRVQLYTGDEELAVTRKPVKVMSKDPPTALETMNRKNKKAEKTGKSRRDEFMETHDFLQDFYYWRSAARINPNKDWKVDALRGAILKEKKRRAKEKTLRIRAARVDVDREQQSRKRTRSAVSVAMENFEAVLQKNDEQLEGMANRRTIGAEYADVADEDLAAEVELSVLGGGYEFDDEEDVQPRGEVLPPPADNMETDALPSTTLPDFQTHHPLRFDDIDDAELNSVINLPGNLLIDKALPLLKKFAETRTDREKMAYEMAKAYEDVDVAVSTLQEQVDKWHSRLEPILDEGETRKEYDVHSIGSAVLAQFATEGDTKSLIELVGGRPWYEISRFFLSCLFMCNVRNVMIGDQREVPLEERINSMKISLLSREMHHEVFQQGDALD